MKLVINQNIVDLAPSADATLLKVVRELGLTGTKEGCASGDCGACTVMVSRPEDEAERQYETVNSCLVPVGQLAGRQVVTVEGLASDDGLHPAQEAMVSCHGSQCGFCTPGFVMSLAALVEAGASGREAVLSGISGNLCRCTGYLPIVAAGLKALASGRAAKSRHGLASAGVTHFLGQPQPTPGEGPVFSPKTEGQLGDALKAMPDAPLIAGGTDLMLEATQRYEQFPALIDISGVAELNRLSLDEQTIAIGAAVPYTRLEAAFSGLSEPMVQLLERLGSRQIRNRGTIGGNLANGSPIADMPPPLIVWGADLHLADATGNLRQMKVEDFYTGYRQTVLRQGEYIRQVTFPAARLACFHRFYKSSKRIEDDISSVLGAFLFTGTAKGITEAKVAYGGMAATPVRLKGLETLLQGEAVSEPLLQAAQAELRRAMTPLTDVRASARYRMDMAVSMFQRALKEFAGERLPLISTLDLMEAQQ